MELLFSPHLVLTLMACAFVLQAAADSPCDSQPCLNGGTCTVDGDNFLCVCPDNFGGDTCNTGERSRRQIHKRAPKKKIIKRGEPWLHH
ncbi:lactadherin isoform X2 [Lingula anatina]|uniref:Lactadherin isoform X2 n=1 Tax=Lingula anatina TaxID=7574 RepID=A0A1S3HF13_LINAN|nr:lactadherin isoform X2 [Lingula anatina]|eukprot:XP_013384662.1 lactadherin isoform X2 [Lingula anatina]